MHVSSKSAFPFSAALGRVSWGASCKRAKQSHACTAKASRQGAAKVVRFHTLRFFSTGPVKDMFLV